MKDTITTNTPEPGSPAGNDAGATTRNPDHQHPNSFTGVEGDDALNDFGAATTEHLRRLWMAGARDITVTYDADAVRHRTYLSHPRTDKYRSNHS